MKLLAILASLALGACDVGVFGPDGASSGDDNNDQVCANRAATPPSSYTHTAAGGGGTNAGNSCIEANCHSKAALGPNAPPWQFAGTVYQTDGTTPNAGAIIYVNAGGKLAKATADTAGNFYVTDLTLATPFPSQTTATACPSITHMVGTLTAGQGSCNGGTGGQCHDSTRRITLQ